MFASQAQQSRSADEGNDPMKTLITTTAFAFAALVLAPAAFADTGDVKTVQGCEIVDMGGYSNKVDPTCVFNHPTGGGSDTSASGPFATLQDIRDLIGS